MVALPLPVYILLHMKQILVEIDDETAGALEKVAPSRSRRRSEFIRIAIRRALWQLEEQTTRDAYLRTPDGQTDVYAEPQAWEPAPRKPTTRKRGRR
jgi:hypothetical protein